MRDFRFRVVERCALAVLLWLGTQAASAGVFNVSTPAEFQTALTTAQANGEDDVINVGECSGAPSDCVAIAGQPTYAIASTLTYTAAATENQELRIEGFDSDTRILNGGELVQILRIDTRPAAPGFNAAITVSGLTFVNGNTPDDGGALAIYTEAPSIEVSGSVFAANSAGDNGGALFVRIEGNNESILRLDDLTFDSNEALGIPNGGGGSGGNGGAVFVEAAPFSGLNIIDVDFLDSTADRNGGCLAVQGLDPTDPVFRRVAEITVFDVLFEGCAASLHGGGAYFAADRSELSRTGFVRNTTSTGDGGGLNVASGWNTLTLVNTGFSENSAYAGGGLWTGDNEGFANLINNTFFQNAAVDGDGGNVFLTIGGSSGLARVYNNIIYNGNALGFGDDIYIDNDPFTDIPAAVEFIANNVGELPTAPLFQNDSFFLRDASVLTISDNIETAPLLPNVLSDPADPKQALNSPTIDAGRSDLAGVPEIDFEADTRPQDGDGNGTASHDIGMDEFLPGAALAADLVLSILESPSPVTSLESLTYAITVDNSGPDTGSNVQLIATLAAGQALTSATPSQGSCSTAGDPVTLTCALGSLADGADATITVVTVAPSVQVNTDITADFAVTATEDDPVGGNDSGAVTTTVVPAGPVQADLTVTKNAAPDPVVSNGPELIYTVTVQNNGPNAATGVLLTDTLPIAAVSFVSVSSSNNASCSTPDTAGELVCELGSLAVNANATVNIAVIPDAVETATTISNTATVTGLEDDPTAGNNTSTVETQVTPPQVDLSITATSLSDAPTVNEQLDFQLTVNNAGPSTGTGVQLVLNLPEDTQVQTLSADQGSCVVDPVSEGNVTASCALGTLPAGDAAVVSLTLVGPSIAKSVDISATVSSAIVDPDMANNSASAAVAVVDTVIVRVRGRGGKSSAFGLLELLLGGLSLLALRGFAARLSMRRRALAAGLTAVALAGAAASTQAESGDWYLGAAGGTAEADYGRSDLLGDLGRRGYAISNPSVDDTDTAWKVYGGYQLTDLFAAEFGYVDLGTVKTGFDAEIPPDEITQLLNDTLDVHGYLGSGWTLAGVGRWSFAEDRYALYARLGAFVWEADIKVKASGGASGRVSGDETGTDIFFGLGAEWRVQPRVSLTLEWERYRLNEWVDVPMLGVRVTF